MAMASISRSDYRARKPPRTTMASGASMLRCRAASTMNFSAAPRPVPSRGLATVLKVGEVMVEPGNGMAMADHDIHATRVVGDRPAVGLALYGYALLRFPSVAW